ncbi:uncharacterized protein TrAtP1_012967 [Trichoderma atroviride]|uniref:uncharacterized protein n=1 Tax=Hypocrea atroviridis TaxID=63577 RepID=UPI003318C8EA|nr:hypothetical protein TrAtP1_012967 [Trichoderma atroviride]
MNISIGEDEDEAEHLLNVLLEDESRPYGSRFKRSLDVASDNDGCGAAVEESNPESNPPLVVRDSTTPVSPPNNRTQDSATENPHNRVELGSRTEFKIRDAVYTKPTHTRFTHRIYQRCSGQRWVFSRPTHGELLHRVQNTIQNWEKL